MSLGGGPVYPFASGISWAPRIKVHRALFYPKTPPSPLSPTLTLSADPCLAQGWLPGSRGYLEPPVTQVEKTAPLQTYGGGCP